MGLVLFLFMKLIIFSWVSSHRLKSQTILSQYTHSYLAMSILLVFGLLLFLDLFLKILTLLTQDEISSSCDDSFSFMLQTHACLLKPSTSPLLASSSIATTFSSKTLICTAGSWSTTCRSFQHS